MVDLWVLPDPDDDQEGGSDRPGAERAAQEADVHVPPEAWRDGFDDDATAVTHRDLRWEELVAEAGRLGVDARFASLSDADIESRLSIGAAELDAAMCRWLELLAEFVVRGVWSDQGARTPGAWLSWKLGIGASTAREHVRVALRLREFPQIRDRFAAGTLSYSKVRCLTRFGDPAFEDLLLEWADDATAAQLESIARGFRTAERARLDAAVDDEVDPAWVLRGRSSADGTRTLTLRGPVEVIAALEDDIGRLADLLVSDRRDTAVPDPQPDGELEPGHGAPSRVTTADRVEALALAVAASAAAETPPDTSGLDRHTLVLSVDADALVAPDAGPGADAASDPVPNAGDRLRADVVPVAEDDRRLTVMDRRVLRRIACEAGVVLVVTDEQGHTLDVGRRSRRTTSALRRAVQQRDRACTFPGCGASRHLHAHHVRHWADGGSTDLGNLVLLCGYHHRFVHQQAWLIEVRSDGRHLYRPASGDAVVERVGRPAGASAEAVTEQAPKTASAEALLPWRHAAGPFDLDLAVAALQARHEQSRALPLAV